MNLSKNIRSISRLLLFTFIFNGVQPLCASQEIEKTTFGQALYNSMHKPSEQTLKDIELFNTIKELAEKVVPIGKDALRKKIEQLKNNGANINQALLYAIIDGVVPINQAAELAKKEFSFESFKEALGQTKTFDSIKKFFTRDFNDKTVKMALELGADPNAVGLHSGMSALEIATTIYMPLYMMSFPFKLQGFKLPDVQLEYDRGEDYNPIPVTYAGAHLASLVPFVAHLVFIGLLPVTLGFDAAIYGVRSAQEHFETRKTEATMADYIEKSQKASVVQDAEKSMVSGIPASSIKKRAEVYEKIIKLLVSKGATFEQLEKLFKSFWEKSIQLLKDNDKTLNDAAMNEIVSSKWSDFSKPAENKGSLVSYLSDLGNFRTTSNYRQIRQIVAPLIDKAVIELMGTLEGLNKKINLEIKPLSKQVQATIPIPTGVGPAVSPKATTPAAPTAEVSETEVWETSYAPVRRGAVDQGQRYRI